MREVARLLMYDMTTGLENDQEKEPGFEVERLRSIGECSNCILGPCDLLD